MRKALESAVSGGVTDAVASLFEDQLERDHIGSLLLERAIDDWPLLDGSYPIDIVPAVRAWVGEIYAPPGPDGTTDPADRHDPLVVALCVGILEQIRREAVRGEHALAEMWSDFLAEADLDKLGPKRQSDYWNPDTTTASFVGRDDELRQLAKTLESGDGIARIQSVRGFGGIGKTRLALAYADRYRDRYPDGRIFYDFQSYSGDHAPQSVDQALLQILPTVTEQISAEQVSRLSPAERLSAWRAYTAGRRLLMVWDNIRNLNQIAELLVRGEPNCATIITSRDYIELSSDNSPLTLDALDDPSAVALFSQVAGSGHDCKLIEKIVEADFRIPVLVEFHALQIRERYRSLEEIASDVESVPFDESLDVQRQLFDRFDGSYRNLSGDQQYALRVFGAHPGYAPTAGSLSAALGCDIREAHQLMDELMKAGFARRFFHSVEISDPSLRSYSSHDSLRDYAYFQSERSGEILAVQDSLANYYAERLQSFRPWSEATRMWFLAEVDNVSNSFHLVEPGSRAQLMDTLDMAISRFNHPASFASESAGRTLHWRISRGASEYGDWPSSD
ncbi:AAA family ATPase [Glycomyces luteolus]|uniref:AAA family ATPase n=1 Tax=Glycomyces luteolus TaxID=2670330 RepID=A0A9X3P6Z1_9ACTN|nr:AAA family ATPase [Glycomyces luteolus]MDA1359811.1 AAA family ATPase [Glycomyces luteolus]